MPMTIVFYSWVKIENKLNRDFSYLCEWFVDNKLTIHFGQENVNPFLPFFVDNLFKYKAYLLHSGYDSEMIDKRFVKVAKMKRKETLKTRTKPKLKGRKYSFVTTWNPGLRDIRKALHKFTNVLTLSGPAFSVVRQARGGAQRPRCQKSRLTSTN